MSIVADQAGTLSPVTSQRKPVLVVVWQSLVVESYRSFFAGLTSFETILIAPSEFRELGMQSIPCAPFDSNAPYRGIVLNVTAKHVQAVWYRGLSRTIREIRSQHPGQPITVISMAEPYSVTTFLCWVQSLMALGRGFRFGCFALQNIFKQFSLPLQWIQSAVFRAVDFILILGREHESVLRKHGYQGRCIYFPLWFDSKRFFCRDVRVKSDRVVVGFIGSLVEEKGVTDLIDAFRTKPKELGDRAALKIAGRGALTDFIKKSVDDLHQLGVDAKYIGALAASDVPKFFEEIDILVVPSRTAPHWKEQFGRVIVEAMACGCTVIGSSSGEIPIVIAKSDRIFPEGDVQQLQTILLQEISAIRQNAENIRADNARLVARYSDKFCASQFNTALGKNAKP